MRSKIVPVLILTTTSFLLSLSPIFAAQSDRPANQSILPKTKKIYQLQSWKNDMCRFKGRFQDQEYCSSKVIDQIIADGKESIPKLISQITDNRWIKEPVYDYWPQIRAGELAVFILNDLFLDDTWQHRTMPDLFDAKKCDESASVCWERFRKNHSLANIQRHWMNFWMTNKDNIYWDNKSRCFRLMKKK